MKGSKQELTWRGKTLRATLILPVFTLLFLLTGCWDHVEVNDMAIIISAGIDKSGDDEIELTVQVFIPNPAAASGEGSGGGGQGNVYTLSQKGASMADALSELQKKLPRYFTWGHAKAFIFGEDLAEKGMFDEFDFLFRDTQPREQANLFVCKGTAKQLIEAQNDPNSYEALIKISQKPMTRVSTMHEVEELIYAESGAFILPVISKIKLMSNESQKSILTVDGMAVIHHRNLIGFLDHESQMGIRLLNKEELGRNITLTQKEEGGKIVIKLRTTKLKLQPSIENGNWKMAVNLKVYADVVQNSTSLDLSLGLNNLRKIEGPFNDQIKQILLNTIHKIQHEQKADVLGFARSFHKSYPKEWKQEKEQWDERFTTMDVQVKVDSKIQKPGITNFPLPSN